MGSCWENPFFNVLSRWWVICINLALCAGFVCIFIFIYWPIFPLFVIFFTFAVIGFVALIAKRRMHHHHHHHESDVVAYQKPAPATPVLCKSHFLSPAFCLTPFIYLLVVHVLTSLQFFPSFRCANGNRPSCWTSSISGKQ